MKNIRFSKEGLALAASFILGLASFARAHNDGSDHIDIIPTVQYQDMTCTLEEGNGTQGLSCEGPNGSGMSLPCDGEFSSLCDQAKPNEIPATANNDSEHITCSPLGDGGLACADQRTGAAFTTTCDARPDLCQTSQGVAVVTPKQNDTSSRGASNPSDNGAIPLETSAQQPDSSLAESNTNAPSTNLNIDPSWTDESALAGMSEGDLRQANGLINQYARERGGNMNSGERAKLTATSRAIAHVLAHAVSRKVIGNLPARYSETDGIYEKPEIKVEGGLVADSAYDRLMRDKTLGEECAGVTHVDMKAQCAAIAPDQRERLFRY